MAIKYLAGNRITGTNSDRTGLASGVTDYINDGTLWLELGTNDMYKWDKAADAWELVTGNAIAESFSNKTFADAITLTEISAPGTPSSGTFVIYPKSDNKLYFKSHAVSKIMSCIPFGFLFSWILRVPGLSIFFDWVYGRISINRMRICQNKD